MFSSGSSLQLWSQNQFSCLQPEVAIQKPKWRLLLWLTGLSYTFIWQSSGATFVKFCTYRRLKGETRVHRMWVNVLPVMYNKCNMAAETGSRNNLHSSSEIDAVWKLITSLWVKQNTQFYVQHVNSISYRVTVNVAAATVAIWPPKLEVLISLELVYRH